MLLMLTHGAWHGLRGSVSTMAGCLLSLLSMLIISATGLGVVLKAWPATFDTLRLIGAAYLIYLGVKAWRSPMREQEGMVEDAAESSLPAGGVARSQWAQFYNGFLVGSSNPKAILFCAALMPQFIDATRPTLPQLCIIVATVAVLEVSWYVVYASFGKHIGARLKRPGFMRAFNRLTGGLFVGFGTAMALARH
jgi:threonine/homoserine/homoserine lactone efflux protein